MGSERQQVGEEASRTLVLSALQQAGPAQTVKQVAAAVNRSIATTRFHLNRLEADGLIRSTPERRDHNPGRPQIRYTARPPEAVDAAAAYRQLADVLGRQLVDLAGADGALAAGAQWAEALTSKNIEAGAEPETLDQLFRFLDDSGFSPRSDASGTRIELHACPFLDLAKDHADTVCTVHLGMVRELLTERTGAVQVTPVLDGSGPCLIQLPAGLTGRHRDRAARTLNPTLKETSMPTTPIVLEADSIR